MAFIPLFYEILLGCCVYFYSFSSTFFSEVLYIMLAYKLSSPIYSLSLSLVHKLAFILTPFISNIINNSDMLSSSLKNAII